MNAVGIDVSKKKSTVTIRQPGDVVLLPPRDYRYTQSSINELIATIKGLDGETKVCIEKVQDDGTVSRLTDETVIDAKEFFGIE